MPLKTTRHIKQNQSRLSCQAKTKATTIGKRPGKLIIS